MKKSILTIILFFCFIFTMFGQEDEQEQAQEQERKFSFQIKPLSYIVMFILNGSDDDSETYSYQFEFEFQYAINNRFNLSVSPFFGTTSSLVYYGTYENGYTYYNNEYIKDIAYGISAGLLYRPWENGLRGMYIGLYPILGMVHVKFKEINDELFILGIMSESGYQWVFKNGFTLALGGGIGFSGLIPLPDTKGKYQKTYVLNYPFDLALRISLGYSFKDGDLW